VTVLNAGMTGEYREAVRRLQAQRRFRIHGLVFLGVQACLVLLNAFTWRGYAWVVWPLFGWGVGLLFHAVSAYALRGSKLDERHVREIMKTLKK
jgi:uncharacterized membrane protein